MKAIRLLRPGYIIQTGIFLWNYGITQPKPNLTGFQYTGHNSKEDVSLSFLLIKDYIYLLQLAK